MDSRQRLNWRNAGFLLVSPLATVAGIAAYVRAEGVHPGDLLNLAVMTTLTGLAITAGYHRYYSHRSYECRLPVRIYYLLFGAAALQAPVLVWASRHRDHHRFVDGEGDPHCARRGFFWAHMGWILHAASSRTPDNVPDLRRDPLVRLQQRFHVALGVVIGLGMPFLIGLAFARPWGGVLWGGLLRVVVAHHGTFLVNSAGHFFGRQPYSTANTSRDSALLAALTLGEGYHNFHHAFPGDYRNGVKWHQWDPTKWWIFTLSALGLASKLRRMSGGRMRRGRGTAAETPARHVG